MDSESKLLEKIKLEREYYLDLYNKAGTGDRDRYYDYYVIYYSCKEFGYSGYTERSDRPKWNKRNRSKILSLKYLGKIAKAVEALQRKDMRECNNSNLAGELKRYKDTLEYLSSRADKISWELVNDKKYN